jgi:hypothetical protein
MGSLLKSLAAMGKTAQFNGSLRAQLVRTRHAHGYLGVNQSTDVDFLKTKKLIY